MKRYIKSSKTKQVDIDTSMFKGTPFQCKTWMSKYDNFLNAKDLAYMEQAKNRTGKIVMMSPEQYFDQCSLYGFGHYVSSYKLKQERRANSKVDKYKELMKQGVKFPLCMLNKADSGQEGLHRMMAAGDLYGWNTPFPVLVVIPYDQEKEDRWKFIDKADAFRDDEFKRYCKWAATKISKWDKPVPDNFIELYRDEIFKVFNDSFLHKYEYIDIDFDIEIAEVEGHQRVYVYLTKYSDTDNIYEFTDRYNPYWTWLDDLYDVEGQYQDTPNTDDIDLDSDLFI